MSVCLVDQCGRAVKVKNEQLCYAHYQQKRKGKPFRTIKRRVLDRNAAGEKFCTRCETFRPESDFAKSAGKADGLQAHCRHCKAQNYRANAAAIRDKMRQQRFGITRAEFDAMLERQGGRCAICRTDEPGFSFWHVDHDHGCCERPGESCGDCIRGILCARCNVGIGSLRDDPLIVAAALEYLTDRKSVA